jgi:hypothetical protein
MPLDYIILCCASFYLVCTHAIECVY